MPVGSWVLSDRSRGVQISVTPGSPMPVGSWVLSDASPAMRNSWPLMRRHQCLSALGFCQTRSEGDQWLSLIYSHQCLSALGFCQTSSTRANGRNRSRRVTNACRLLGFVRLRRRLEVTPFKKGHQCLSALGFCQTSHSGTALRTRGSGHQCLSALGFCQTEHQN